MSLQIVTLKEIEKEKNRRYDTSDRRVLSRDLLGGIFPPNFGNSPQEFQYCPYFYVAGKMNRYCIAARLSSKSNL